MNFSRSQVLSLCLPRLERERGKERNNRNIEWFPTTILPSSRAIPTKRIPALCYIYYRERNSSTERNQSLRYASALYARIYKAASTAFHTSHTKTRTASTTTTTTTTTTTKLASVSEQLRILRRLVLPRVSLSLALSRYIKIPNLIQSSATLRNSISIHA